MSFSYPPRGASRLLALSLLAGIHVAAIVPAFSELPTATSNQASGGFIDGVLAYRQGQYVKAEQIFKPLHEQAPDQSRITYYLALIKSQLGDFPSAKALFEEVTMLDPNGEAARLSKQALQQFQNINAGQSSAPDDNGFQLDLPPNLNALSNQPASPTTPSTNNNNAAAGNNFSPQDIMMMQMMMGGNGGNNGNNTLNPMMLQSMMNQGQGNGQQGQSSMDPNIMSTMLMNQMMQNFNLDSKSNNNNE